MLVNSRLAQELLSKLTNADFRESAVSLRLQKPPAQSPFTLGEYFFVATYRCARSPATLRPPPLEHVLFVAASLTMQPAVKGIPWATVPCRGLTKVICVAAGCSFQILHLADDLQAGSPVHAP